MFFVPCANGTKNHILARMDVSRFAVTHFPSREIKLGNWWCDKLPTELNESYALCKIQQATNVDDIQFGICQ